MWTQAPACDACALIRRYTTPVRVMESVFLPFENMNMYLLIPFNFKSVRKISQSLECLLNFLTHGNVIWYI